MTDVTAHTRFKDAPWYKYILDKTENLGQANLFPIIIGGTGGIGSWVSLCLARMGLYLVVYDFDTVDEFNLGGQFFKLDQIGRKKTVAMAANLSDFCHNFGYFSQERYSDTEVAGPVMISCFDDMTARKDMYNVFKASTIENKIFIDGRLTAEVYEVYCVTEQNQDEYEQYLFDNDEADDVSCTYSQSTFMALGIASIMTNCLMNHFTNLQSGFPIFEVPLKTYYHAPTMSFV